MGNIKLSLVIGAIALIIAACGENNDRKIEPVTQPIQPALELVPTPDFNADSAYAFVQKQVDFGPRVPNTEAHKACATWLQSELKRFGLEVSAQQTTVTAYNGTPLEIFNIAGRYKPEAKTRILLCAHWDTRPYADRDDEMRTKPIDGANDGGSGVAVLLEMARIIALDSLKPDVGFDIVFFDAEDYGKPEASMVGKANDSWCLGSQYWSANIPFENYKPRYGILLDMVGAANAVFPKEAVSMHYAPHVVDLVWNIAGVMGHRAYFSNVNGNPITDDHNYLNSIAGIPTIDIIHYDMFRNDFGSFHHTHEDNMDVIDKNTLKVVGDVMLQVLYSE